MATLVLLTAFGIAGLALAAAGIRDAVRDRFRPVRTDPAYDTRRPHLER